MRRSKLIWFAAGAATSAVATTTATIFNAKDEEVLLLRVHEPEFDPTPEEWEKMDPEERNLSNIAVRTGEIARACGVGAFSNVLPGSLHSGPYIEFNVLTSSPVAIDCVLEESRQINARASFHKMAES